MRACCDTHHISNLLPFIISLYSQRPHLTCYYQRSLLFPFMYVWNPTETNVSAADNRAILVHPIVYVLPKPEFPLVISRNLIQCFLERYKHNNPDATIQHVCHTGVCQTNNHYSESLHNCQYLKSKHHIVHFNHFTSHFN